MKKLILLSLLCFINAKSSVDPEQIPYYPEDLLSRFLYYLANSEENNKMKFEVYARLLYNDAKNKQLKEFNQ